MKKLSLLLVALLLVCFILPVFSVSAAEEFSFWISHYNNVSVEGAGVVITDNAYLSVYAWRISVAFAPVEGTENVFQITNMVDYLGSDSISKKITVPAGGFVYQINQGNDYISLGQGNVDYTSDNNDAMINTVRKWSVGDTFVINNIDLVNKTVPTTTSDVNWYDDGYVCTATYSIYDPSNPPASSTSSSADTTVNDNTSETDSPDDSKTSVDSSAASSADSSESDSGANVTVIVVSVCAAVVVVAAAVVVVVLSKKKK